MNFSIDRIQFLQAMQDMASVSPASSPLQALTCTRMEANTDTQEVILTANNLEFAVERTIPASVKEGGVTLSPTSLLLQMVMLLGEKDVLFMESQSRQYLQSGQAKYLIMGLPAENYPLPDFTLPEKTARVSNLRTLYKRTAFSACHDKEKPTLGCIRLDCSPDSVRAAACNTFCLMTVTYPMEDGGDSEFLLPATSLRALAAMIGDQDVLEIGADGKYVYLSMPNFRFRSTYPEGGYMEVDALLSNIKDTYSAAMNAKDLRDAIESVSVIAGEGGIIRMQLQSKGALLHTVQGRSSSKILCSAKVLTPTAGDGFCYRGSTLKNAVKSMDGLLAVSIDPRGTLLVRGKDAAYMQLPTRQAVKKKKAAEKKEKAAAA